MESNLALSYESDVEAVNTAEADILAFLRTAGVNEEDAYFIGLAAREVIVNAIKHGNQFDPHKRVGVSLSHSAQGLTLEVTDEGEGFLLHQVPDPSHPDHHAKRSGRGLAITRGIMDEVTVEKVEPRGTRVRMHKLLAGA